MNALPSAQIGGASASFNADNRYQIRVVSKEFNLTLTHYCSIGKYRENDIPVSAGVIKNVRPHHWLSACKQYE